MRVLFADSNHPVLHELLQHAGHACDLFWDQSAEQLQAILPQYDALVIRSKFKLSKEVLAKAERLKCIGRVGAGLENIDLAYAKEKGIVCLNVPEGNRDAVGEHALGMLLMLLNHLKRADAEVRKGIWRRAENRGTEIGGKCVAIIGYGNMGQSFAKKLSGFDCEVLAYDKFRSHYSDAWAKESSLNNIFEKADIVSLHVPLTEETKYMLDASFFSNFKKGIYLINTARGKCLNTADLLEALKTEKVLGACLDVLEFESVSFEKVSDDALPAAYQNLLLSDKVILSPHIAGWTHESNYKMSKGIAEKMIAELASRN